MLVMCKQLHVDKLKPLSQVCTSLLSAHGRSLSIPRFPECAMYCSIVAHGEVSDGFRHYKQDIAPYTSC